MSDAEPGPSSPRPGLAAPASGEPPAGDRVSGVVTVGGGEGAADRESGVVPVRAGGARATDEMDDLDLVLRCIGHDHEAFRVFVARYEPMVFRVLSRLAVRRGQRDTRRRELEDLAQEVFLNAFRAFPRYVPHGSAKPSTWLYEIAINVARDFHKKRALATEPIEPWSSSLAAPADASPEVAWERRELGDAIAAAAEELPHALREVFVLSKLEGLSPREIARIVGIGPITVRTRLFRAKHLMRKKLRAFRRSRR
ncbi:RNA polymerase sigma factor [Polyangium aurulentum]|uniref:RNA polymerase sigma factor n=1 Tax=Polyangium aurulentum TaxID=2567896 RepID=UPI00146E17CC|nr:sigma-70 family RNA polymerase sigma factor [Polyangium aurulentum]UQA62928.1 sigma-70 family RNA polymerase sigma factor [Polyangium aurulentum]